MRTVDIGIGHDDYLMITKLCLIKFISYTCTKCHNYRLKLLICIYFIDTSLLNVKHLTPERKDSLILSLTTLLSRSAGGISLNDEDLTELGFIGLTIGKLTGKRVRLEYSLSSCHLTSLLSCVSCTACR